MHAYLDGELDALTGASYEQHVQTCPACARLLAEQKGLAARMKADALYYRAPETLRTRLLLTLRQQSRRRPLRSVWPWLGVASCVGLGLLLVQWLVVSSARERLTQEVLASHVRSLQLEQSRVVDVRSSDRHEVKPWFVGKLDYSPPVPDLAGAGFFFLVGGRLDYIDGRPVAALVYHRRKHVINVFVWPDPGHEEEPPRQQTRQGYHLFHYRTGGMSYWVISDLNQAELGEFVGALRM
jgi:anti-sigma factor RsiW